MASSLFDADDDEIDGPGDPDPPFARMCLLVGVVLIAVFAVMSVAGWGMR